MNETEKTALNSELEPAIASKTDLKNWAYNLPLVSIRLLNVVTALYDEKTVVYLEEVTKQHFDFRKNAGIKTWTEFVEARGY